MKKLLSIPLLLSLGICTAQKNEDAAKYANMITGKGLKEKLTVVASAEMEGRETATPGQKKAAAYIEAHFKKLGLKPANGDSYQQYYPVYQDELVNKNFSVNGQQFEWDKDFTLSLQMTTSGNYNFNDAVFAGYGIVDSVSKTNDYSTLSVAGKIVVILDGLPDGFKTTGNARFGPGSAFVKIANAKAKGAAGLFVVSKDFPRKMATAFKGNMYLKRNDGGAFFTASISEKVVSALLGRTSTLTSDKIKEVNKGIYYSEIKLNVNKLIAELQSSNVAGLLEGTDKKDEYVVLTGHYDHLGKRDNVIYYGADDDGSGTVSVMQMAEAFVAAKKKGNGPRRSILFMTVSGEEKGLWGSQYYSENPLLPLAKTSVNLNTDMVGRVGSEFKGDTGNYVYVIGEDKLSSDLMPITDSINTDAKLVLDRRYNDINDPNRFYYRSDHYNFAKAGVPIIFYFDGVHADYHKPTDTVEKINFSLMEKRVKLIFNTAWVMANRAQMLKRDIPLNIPPR